MRRHRTILIAFTSALLSILALLASGCSTTEVKQDTGDSVSDSIEDRRYGALDDSASAPGEESLSRSARLASVIEQLPGENLIDNSIEITDSEFIDMAGIDDVASARYVFDRDTVTFFATRDASGVKYLALVEFATTQSQVRPSLAPFDRGYSVDFRHRQRGRVVGGLKAGYLVGVIGYRDTLDDFMRRWVNAID